MDIGVKWLVIQHECKVSIGCIRYSTHRERENNQVIVVRMIQFIHFEQVLAGFKWVAKVAFVRPSHLALDKTRTNSPLLLLLCDIQHEGEPSTATSRPSGNLFLQTDSNAVCVCVAHLWFPALVSHTRTKHADQRTETPSELLWNFCLLVFGKFLTTATSTSLIWLIWNNFLQLLLVASYFVLYTSGCEQMVSVEIQLILLVAFITGLIVFLFGFCNLAIRLYHRKFFFYLASVFPPPCVQPLFG